MEEAGLNGTAQPTVGPARPAGGHHPAGRPRRVMACLSPLLIATHRLEECVVVVIDVLRATTTICVALRQGVREIVPVTSIEECAHLRNQGYLAAAERNGYTVPGFDFGNSPYSFMRPDLAGARLALTTTNGTRAIAAARGAAAIVTGAFANLTALAAWLRQQPHDVLLLCSGWKDAINLEDSMFAGAVVEELGLDAGAPAGPLGPFVPHGDSAFMARTLYRQSRRNLRFFLQGSTHYQRLLDLGLQKDVKFCLRRDTAPALPLFDGRALADALPALAVGQ